MRILFTSRSSGEVELGLAKSLRIKSYPNDTEIKYYAQKLIEQKVMLVSRMKALSVGQQDEIFSKIVQSAGGVLVHNLSRRGVSTDSSQVPCGPISCSVFGRHGYLSRPRGFLKSTMHDTIMCHLWRHTGKNKEA